MSGPDTRRQRRTGAEPDLVVCRCFGVDEPTLRAVIRRRGLRTAEEVATALGAGAGCGSCRGEVEEILAEIWGEKD